MRDAAFLYAEEKRENNRECTENTEKWQAIRGKAQKKQRKVPTTVLTHISKRNGVCAVRS